MQIVIKDGDMGEFLGQIIEEFEDFLDEKGIYLDNPEKLEAIRDGEDPECIANIYGTDYGILQVAITDILHNWEVGK